MSRWVWIAIGVAAVLLIIVLLGKLGVPIGIHN